MFTPELLVFLRNELAAKESELENKRAAAKQWGNAVDWPWNAFVLSFATHGGSRHWEDTVEPKYDERYSWAALGEVSPEERVERIMEIANPRFRKKLGVHLLENYERFRREGGPEAIRKEYFSKNTIEDRMEYLKTFKEIGPKYSRNIPMDSYDPMLGDHFAIDSRISELLPMLGYTGGNAYTEQEKFLNHLAKKLEVSSWTLDRLLYSYHKEIKDFLG